MLYLGWKVSFHSNTKNRSRENFYNMSLVHPYILRVEKVRLELKDT